MNEENKEIIVHKKNNKIITYIIILLALLLIGTGTVFLIKSFNNDNNDKNNDIVEEKINLKDDFYESINKGNSKIPFVDAQQTVYRNLAELITKIENDDSYTDDNYFAFIGTFEDGESRNNKDISELKSYFDEIDNAQTLDQFSDIFIKVNYDLGINSFLNWELMPDLYDTSKNVIAIEPMLLERLSTFTMTPTQSSSLEFFTSDKYKIYKEAFEEARIEFLKLYVYDEEKAKEISNNINEFAKVIQDKSVSFDELRGDPTKYYKNYSYNELKSIVKNLPIDKFLQKYNISSFNSFVLIDEGHIKALDDYYTKENLPLMKEILKVTILEEMSLHLTQDYAQIFTKCFEKLSGESGVGVDQVITYYEYFQLKPKIMGSYLNVKYDEEYFTEVEKLEIVELINKVKEYYKEVINTSSWLEDSTKEVAIKKLNTMKVNVGYVQKEVEPITLKYVSEENGGTLISNIILLNKDKASKLVKEVNKEFIYEVDQFMANAYYFPLDNSINFLSGFRDVYRNITDKYERYAYAGMIIAHEISHAFDNNGSLYDEKGNLRDWWSEKDKENFDNLKQKIIDYYSNYEIFGLKVDGKITVGENIADLAAVKTILNIMESENATTAEYEEFFESLAKLWNEKTNRQQVELTMLSDTHSPNKIRVNAVLSSMDKFYEVYDIKEEDKMFVPKEERVGLW